MTNTHEKEQIKKLLMICGLTLEAIKNLSIKFEELPEWQKSALPDEFDNACDLLLFAGLKLGAVLVEFDAAGRVSEVEE